MTDEDKEAQVAQLLADTAETRARLETDAALLVEQLSPTEIKHRAVDAAERSATKLLAQGRAALARAPRWLVRSFRQHPLAGVGIVVAVAAAGALIWRSKKAEPD